MEEIYQQLGEAGITDMVAAFYKRIPEDDLIGPMYPADDMAGSEKRLRDFLIFRFGGPQDYIEQRGHPRLRMRHVPFKIGLAERDRWLSLMDAALEEAAIPEPAATTLREFFAPTADFMRNIPG